VYSRHRSISTCCMIGVSQSGEPSHGHGDNVRKNRVKFGRVVFELRERTDRHTRRSTSHPSRGTKQLIKLLIGMLIGCSARLVPASTADHRRRRRRRRRRDDGRARWRGGDTWLSTRALQSSTGRHSLPAQRHQTRRRSSVHSISSNSLASTAVQHWGTCPIPSLLDFQFIFRSLWNCTKSDSDFAWLSLQTFHNLLQQLL